MVTDRPQRGGVTLGCGDASGTALSPVRHEQVHGPASGPLREEALRPGGGESLLKRADGTGIERRAAGPDGGPQHGMHLCGECTTLLGHDSARAFHHPMVRPHTPGRRHGHPRRVQGREPHRQTVSAQHPQRHIRERGHQRIRRQARSTALQQRCIDQTPVVPMHLAHCTQRGRCQTHGLQHVLTLGADCRAWGTVPTPGAPPDGRAPAALTAACGGPADVYENSPSRTHNNAPAPARPRWGVPRAALHKNSTGRSLVPASTSGAPPAAGCCPRPCPLARQTAQEPLAAAGRGAAATVFPRHWGKARRAGAPLPPGRRRGGRWTHSRSPAGRREKRRTAPAADAGGSHLAPD